MSDSVMGGICAAFVGACMLYSAASVATSFNRDVRVVDKYFMADCINAGGNYNVCDELLPVVERNFHDTMWIQFLSEPYKTTVLKYVNAGQKVTVNVQ